MGLVAERAMAAGFGVGRATAEGEIGRSHLEDGTGVPAETSRRLSCDAAIVKVPTDGDGSVLDVARRTRTIPPALRRPDGEFRFFDPKGRAIARGERAIDGEGRAIASGDRAIDPEGRVGHRWREEGDRASGTCALTAGMMLSEQGDSEGQR